MCTKVYFLFEDIPMHLYIIYIKLYIHKRFNNCHLMYHLVGIIYSPSKHIVDMENASIKN